MKKCPNCGILNADSSAYCTNCGSSLKSSSGCDNSSCKNINVHGYTQWFAVNPAVQVYVNGEKVVQVQKGEIITVPVPGPCQMKFTCHVRSVTINVNPDVDSDIFLSFDRMSGCLLANTNSGTRNSENGVDVQSKTDKPNIWLDILSFIIPIVGLILFFSKRAEYPSSAKSYLICSICGFVVNLIIYFS